MMTPAGAKALVVLSCHRSGTSLLTRVLALAGAALPENVLPPLPDHPDGFWEPEKIMRFNEHLLLHLDSSWDDTFGPRNTRKHAPEFPPEAFSRARELISEEFGGKPFIVFKEPRSALLWPFWRDVLHAEGFSIRYVIPVREPIEVAQSLKTRNDMSKNQALLLWTNYMIHTERHTRGEPRVFVSFDNLINNPERELDRIEERLGLRLPRRTWHSAAEIETFVKPGRRTSRAGSDTDLGQRFSPVRKLHAFLEALAADKPANEDVPGATAEWLDGLDETVTPILRASALRSRRELEAAHALAAHHAQAAQHAEQTRLESESRLTDAEARGGAAEMRAQESDAAHAAALGRLEEAERAEQDSAAAVAELVEAEAALRLSQTRAAEAEKVAQAADAKAAEAEAQLKLADARALQAEASLQAAEQRQRELEADQEAVRAQLVEAETKAGARLDELSARLSSAAYETAEAVSAREAVVAELARVRRAGEEAIGLRDALAAELADRDRRLAEADAELRVSREGVAALKSRQGVLQSARDEAEAERARLEQQLQYEAQARQQLTETFREANRHLERTAARNLDILARAEQAEHLAREAQDRVTVVESALLVARRQAGEVEALLQRRVTEAELEGRARAQAAERAGLERDEARAALERLAAERSREVEAVAAQVRRHAELERSFAEKERTFAAEDAEVRDTLAHTAVSAHAAQTRVRELQAQLDQARGDLEQERGRSWWSRLVGRS